ncbi:MAG: helix-turn-helix transcriptional regulator [Xanthomonadales bacterium]|nr:helix-turn-helix transcriptional regulator [Xanthomonadales bacterium]
MLESQVIALDAAVVHTDKTFYAALGQRIAERRKAIGLTQQQLADALGLAQQTLAHYEVGRLRVAVALLPPLSRALGVSLEDLLGLPPKAGKRGPAPRLQAQIERIGALPRGKQRMLLDMIDAALHGANAQAACSCEVPP